MPYIGPYYLLMHTVPWTTELSMFKDLALWIEIVCLLFTEFRRILIT